MNIETIPVEIIHKVFKVLYEEALLTGSFRYLYSCITVSRTWCTSAIPILWSAFKSSKYSIIQTLVSCLNANRERYNELDNIILILQHDAKPTLFNYPSFVKIIDHYELNSAVYNWSNVNHYEQYGDAVLYYMLKSFKDNSARLETLKIENVNDWIPLKNGFMMFVKPEFSIWLSNLKELVVELSNEEDTFLELLTNHCQNLRNIKIRFYDQIIPEHSASKNIQNIYTLISKQKGLKSLKISFCKLSVQTIIRAMLSQANTLQEVEFWIIDFSKCDEIGGLVACKNLKGLVFEHCRNLSSECFKSLVFVKFQKLKSDEVVETKCDALITWSKNFVNG
ncbi:10075_t:CDS:2 [Dentiscutata erythropus]|uniref:10075_t:CDS:1 n=1 Tax=Dentiscutata erythropus TaxID=1348616 RepID=A0A9N9AXM2_9GLOM|nr:10075_t:CDS:2 [Dentiscutata erythropus]